MKRKLFTLVVAASMAVVSFTGCKKDAASPGKGGGLKEKLVGSYKMTKLTLTQVDPETQEEQTTDILDQYSSCDRDNIYVLKSDMTSQVIDAGEQCSPSSDDTGSWSLPDNNTIVMDEQTYHIDSMDGTNLKMSVDIEQDGVEATLKMTYVKQ